MDANKGMLKLSNEEPKNIYSPIHDNKNLVTLSTSVKDPSFITPPSPPFMETLLLADPLTKVHI